MQSAIEVTGLGKSFGTAARAGRPRPSPSSPARSSRSSGVNGAGKTTTINILTTLLQPDEGTAIVAGCDVSRDPVGVTQRIALTGPVRGRRRRAHRARRIS